MLSNKKPFIEKHLQPFIKPLAKINPNLLTLLGSIPSLFFFVFVVYRYYYLALIALPFLAMDLLDGTVARISGRETAFGGFLDSVMDRISDFLLISAFGFGKIVRWEIVVLFLFSVFLVSYVRSRGELAGNKAITFNLGLIERTERIIGIFLGLVGYIFASYFALGGYNFPELFFIFLFLLSLFTFFQRVLWAYKRL